jgi:Ser/Thr protein kinase RdoA (MazF antagonist)
MVLHPILIDLFAGLYGVSPSELQPVAGGHFSDVYEYHDGRQACILRITPPDPDIDSLSMQAVLEWLAFLSAHDGPAPHPVRSKSGKLIESIEHGGRVYLAGAFEKAPGVLAEGTSLADWSDALFRALGRALGCCHRVAQIYVPARAEFRRPAWDGAANCFNPRWALEDADCAILRKRVQVLPLIQALPKDRESYGLAHLDLHFGNFSVDAAQEQIVFLDWDDCAYGWYAMDVAMLLFDALVVYDGPERQQFAARFLENLLAGYRAQMPFRSFWVGQLPHFTKLLEIGVYLMLYRDCAPDTADGWEARFMPGRRDRIERDVPYV